ncbi:cell division protein FtsX [Sphingomonas cavernae]|uniref:Cell division protein n=1 Tax=Sphingomonas cavernae TaxID=2320861 RepID=A0A418WRH6_9SPHN|nr:FtsX-like permease family protein [Sphingomonas cavernae]RJF93749.1 cell division protein [Sphingomonas cavernae]
MSFGWAPSVADRRLLPEGRFAGPMPWVIAIMMFLTALAAAAGLGLSAAARGLGDDLAGRLTVQIVEANPDTRKVRAEIVERALARAPGVVAVKRFTDQEIAGLLEPWLGGEGLSGQDLPIPALIDVSLADGSIAGIRAAEQAVRAVAPAARIDRHARWLAPLAGLIASLKWLAAVLVILMAAATASAVVLAARAALNTHRATIDVLHLMGATDVQIARLFQRRIALDALFGGFVGLLSAIAVLLLLGSHIAAIGSELLGSVGLSWIDWAIIVSLPFAGALLATLAARITVLKTLRKML